jgi:hypothetical protein
LWRIGVISGARHNTFDPTLAFGTRQQHFTVARKATNANIGSDSNNSPTITTAWMLFTHLHNITDY